MLTGSFYGVPVRLNVPDGVDVLLPPGFETGPDVPEAREFTVTGEPDWQRVRGELELHLAEHAPGLIFIHAGAVAFGGRALVLPGRSMAGKSTLTRALVEAGAEYYSDEFAILGEDGLLLPYPRALHLRSEDSFVGVPHDVSQFGTLGTRPVRVALVAELRYGGEWSVTAEGNARATLALIDNAVAAQTRTEEVLDRCAAVGSRARFIVGTRDDAELAAERLLTMLRDDADQA